MFLSLATTHRPATELGFLLMKHPDRTHEVDLGFGKAIVLFPESSQERCEGFCRKVFVEDATGPFRGFRLCGEDRELFS